MTLRSRSKRRSQLTEIREFVYLDEVSVESLLASIDGEILVQSTSTKSSSMEFGASGNSSSMFQQAEFSPSLKATRGKEMQELRKSVAQSAFARFRNRNKDLFALRPIDSVQQRRNDPLRLANLDPKALRRLRQGIPIKDLKRGDLLEVETNLSAADIFKARTAMNAVSDVIEAYPSFLSVEQRDAFRAVRPLTELIDRLNGNAIPVIGENSTLGIETVDGEPWLLQTGTPNAANAPGSLLLESVVQPQWFWGDVGRTLFQNHRFRILCRVIASAPTSSPSSSYVGAILSTVDPSLAATVDGIGKMFLGALRAGHQQSQQQGHANRISAELIDWYARRISELGAPVLDVSARVALQVMEKVPFEDLSIMEQAKFFTSIDDVMSAESHGISADQRSELRDEARSHFGLWPWLNHEPIAYQSTEELGHDYLEVEIVAAYW